MSTRSLKNLMCVLPVLAAGLEPARASFHVMQIEQVIGGVNGDTSIQAIQLRQRSSFQNIVSQGRLIVRNASGASPIIIVDMTTDVANFNTGDRILIASSNFPASTTPAAVPDFVMTNLIPASYMAAGSLTFEDDFGTVYWRLSWGGAAYTGSHTGSPTNDANGNFGPAFAGPLPSTSLQALQFKFAATAPSITNANDYAITVGPAVFVNNARNSFTVFAQPPACEPCDSNCDGSINLFDIGPFVEDLQGSGGCSPCASDANEDGSINLFDIDAFVACL